MAITQTSTAAPPTALRSNAIGLLGVLFQSVALMGPGVAIAFGASAGISYAGGSFPLALLIAMIACILLALNFGQLAKHLPSAGSFYTYVSRGLGSAPGFLAGWIGMPIYLLFIPLNLLAWGFAVQGLSGLSWWIPAVVIVAIMGTLALIGVRLSVRTQVTLGTIEVVAFLLLSIFLILRAPDGNTLRAFTFATWTNGEGGFSGILLGIVIAFLFFTGFESAASLAEESKNPERTVRRAILLAVILIGIFFVFVSYAGLAGYGWNHIGAVGVAHSYLGDNSSGTPWFTLAKTVWGNAGSDVLGLIILVSLGVNILAGFTALSRLVFAMGRASALPTPFGKVHARFRTPWLAIVVAVPLSILIAAWAAAVYGAPPNSFQVILAVTADFVLLAYIAVSLAVPFYYRRERSTEWNTLRHAVIPGITALLLAVILVAQFVTATPPPHYPGLPPQYLGGAIAAAWLIVGLIWVLVLRARRPAALVAGEMVYTSPTPDTVSSTSTTTP